MKKIVMIALSMGTLSMSLQAGLYDRAMAKLKRISTGSTPAEQGQAAFAANDLRLEADTRNSEARAAYAVELNPIADVRSYLDLTPLNNAREAYLNTQKKVYALDQFMSQIDQAEHDKKPGLAKALRREYKSDFPEASDDIATELENAQADEKNRQQFYQWEYVNLMRDAGQKRLQLRYQQQRSEAGR